MNEPELRALIKAAVEEGQPLARVDARAVLGLILAAPEPLPDALALPLTALLTAMAGRGETAEELSGFAEAIRAAGTPVPLTDEERARLVDTCGTGGDGLDTFNISTAAALVAAGAGAWVAKHGNRAVTSRCGSADVLEALGVPIDLPPEKAAACLRATGFMFLLAPVLHPAMRRVAHIRRALPFRTIFNLAGPLANPAGAAAQVVGVYAEGRIPVVAEALRLLGTRHSWVVHGRVQGHGSGLDELTTTGENLWCAVTGSPIQSGTFRADSLGFPHTTPEALRGGANAAENAAILEAILTEKDRGPRRDITLLNAAAALVVSEIAPTLADGLKRAAEALTGGAAHEVLQQLRAFEPH